MATDVEAEAPWPHRPVRYAKAVREGERLRSMQINWLHFYRQLADDLTDGSAALVINHGGVAEMGAVACLPDADHASWGPHFECCEGFVCFGKMESL